MASSPSSPFLLFNSEEETTRAPNSTKSSPTTSQEKEKNKNGKSENRVEMLGSKYFAIKLFGRTILLQPNNGVGEEEEEEKSLGIINGTPPEHKHQDQDQELAASFNSCADEEQSSDSTGNSKEKAKEKKRQQPPETTVVLPCPRCRSSNTKFCYYNNRKVSQPRHFCKNCQRYWTAGGFTRNVPVGSGRRKKKNTSSKIFAVQNDCKLSTGTSVMPFYYAAAYCDSAPSFGKIDALRERGGGGVCFNLNSFMPIQ